MDDTERIVRLPPQTSGSAGEEDSARAAGERRIAFDRQELFEILSLYGRKVAQGEWRDYAIDFGGDTAVFAVFRRTSEVPLYRIEKTPRLSRRQGAYAVVAQGGFVLKRGHDLRQVLRVLLQGPKLQRV
ncbi:MAG: DUF2794 domain-containing protein [Aestuariivirgaceae bacterium]